jgi:hypothetical protein
VQLLLEPRHEEQRVVGRCADDEDRQDALALSAQVDGAVLGQREDYERRERQPQERGDEHSDRQDRAAVDDEEDDEHDAEGDEQEDPVDALEGGDEVREEPPRAGHVQGHPRRCELGCAGGTQRLGNRIQDRRAGDSVLGPVGEERDGDEDRLLVLTGDRRLRWCLQELADGAGTVVLEGEVRDRGDVCLHRLPVGRGQSTRLLDDDEVGQGLRVGRLLHELVDRSRLGRRGQEVRVVVGLDLGESADQRSAHGADGEPGHDGEQRNPADPSPHVLIMRVFRAA